MKKQLYNILKTSCFAGICFLSAITAMAQKEIQQSIVTQAQVDSKTMNEDYLLEKKDVAKSLFRTYVGTMAYFISGNWCFAEFNSIRWSICEEK